MPVGVQSLGNFNGMCQEIQPPISVAGIRAQERRLMLPPRIEQKSRSRLDHATQMQRLKLISKRFAALGQIRLVGIQDVIIERQGHTSVTQFREDGKGILQPMMGEAVGVVAEAHCYTTGSMYSTSGTRRRSSSSMPIITAMIVLGQPLHTPSSRTRATPPATSINSISPPSICSAGATSSASIRATRLRKSDGSVD